ncbi:MAG: MBL fold metallo-hydrolase [Oscillospiraceae bacterium]|nr:MBL fold metallo-hydrolase [Oscillospiraceae bacterium]
MKIQRVAGAGVLLELDGVRLLLDGFCNGEGPYVGTPEHLAESLLSDPPHILAFTHIHADHFSGPLAEQYCKQTLRPILGPENLPCKALCHGIAVGQVSIRPVKSRHIGKEYQHVPHYSYEIRGSRNIWFMGDATPAQWHGLQEHADVIIAPFAYALSDSAWKMTCALADQVVLVHMPLQENDPDSLWPQVEAVTEKHCRSKLLIPELEEIIELP